ncbi:hypothetical protein D932_01316 [Enterococcus casseliflavus 14-MB-W-14]|nr:hypothetical protein D932_01316 [Enterococcus casseliflavus 14-MB-W-14]
MRSKGRENGSSSLSTSLTCDVKLRTLGVANVGTAMHDFAKKSGKAV